MPYSPSRLAEAVKSTIEKMEETMPGDPTVAKIKRRVILLLSGTQQPNRRLNMLLVARPQTECDGCIVSDKVHSLISEEVQRS
jgi:hypothetical protein